MIFHNGQIFRTATEARWARSFEYLQVPYEYEKQVFKLDESFDYLPDFWLPEQNIWIEVKKEVPKLEERDRAIMLYEITGKKVYIFAGFPNVLSFSDPIRNGGYIYEICNFGTYVVDDKNPGACIQFPSKTANEAMMHVLGLTKSDSPIQEDEFRMLTARFNKAANYGNENFSWIDY
ncbi:MAG: hypothetical protein H6662_14715 [Ardenticatenaceae bacterium]|nr:hypothetical protein [Anaerolineales bacterium]MCB8922837.1 hypothetical protein [Ardenticatenaceae bacterium]